MKHKLQLWVMMLFSVLLSINQAWGADGDTHEFPQTLSQLLNNNATIASINIPEQSYPIKEVIVTYGYTKSLTDAVTIEVFVGSSSTSWGSKNIPASTSPISFTGSVLKGTVTISFTNNTGSGTGHGTLSVSKVTLVEGSGTTYTDYFMKTHGSVFNFLRSWDGAIL